MLLLSDGSVFAQGNTGVSSNWYRLTPVNGSYIQGMWTTNMPMHYTRLYYSSAVLKDGRVFVAGGEYGTGTTNAEVYDPMVDLWSIIPVPSGLITTNNTIDSVGADTATLDSACSVLPDGRFPGLARQTAPLGCNRDVRPSVQHIP